MPDAITRFLALGGAAAITALGACTAPGPHAYTRGPASGAPPIPTGFHGPAQPPAPRPHEPGAWNRGHAAPAHAPAPGAGWAPHGGQAPVSYRPAPAWPDAVSMHGGAPTAHGAGSGPAGWPTGAGASPPHGTSAPQGGHPANPWASQPATATAWPTAPPSVDPWGSAAGGGNSAGNPGSGSRLAGGSAPGSASTGEREAASDPMAQVRARLAQPLGGPDPLAGLERRGLYDADRGAVPAQQPGGVERLREPARELETSGGGRLYLLEMYQQALDERDALEMEAAGLTSHLEQLQQRVAHLEQERAKERERVLELERAADELRGENQDLAARLVTAQIRRLEAEKMLIELRIEQERGGSVGVPRESRENPAAEASVDAAGLPSGERSAQEVPRR